MVVITSVWLVPFCIVPIYQVPLVLLYVPIVAVELTYSTWFGSMSTRVTLFAAVPLFAFLTIMVQVTLSPMWYVSLSTVFSTDTSTFGCTLIVLLTVLLNPFGPFMVQLFVWVPIAVQFALMVIIASVFAGMSVTVHIRVLLLMFSKLITLRPVMLTVSTYVTPSGRLSVSVTTCVYVSFAMLVTVKLYSIIS